MFGRVVSHAVNLPARCDCGLLWQLTIDQLYPHRVYACPGCGAPLEVRSYGPPPGERVEGAVDGTGGRG
jgi:hypothetical protein